MELIIFYSAPKTALLEEAATSLAFNEISFIPHQIPQVWTLGEAQELVALMARYSHSLFLVDAPSLGSNFLTFAVGYSFGKHISTSFLVSTAGDFPRNWPENVHVFTTVEALMAYFNSEYKNYHRMLRQAWARGELEKRGKEISSFTLIEAVQEGEVAILNLFLEAGYSPDFTDRKGVPLLCLGVRKNNINIVRDLVEYGADLNLQAKDRGNTPLMDAAAEGHPAVVSLLLSHGAEVEAVSKSGQTALVLAAGQGNVEICTLLIKAGADPKRPDMLGMSALQYATLFRNTALVELFEGK